MVHIMYMAKPNTQGRVVAESVRSRGLNLLKAAPSDLTVAVYVEYPAPGYGDYLLSLPAFGQAWYTKTIVPFKVLGTYPILSKERFPVNRPVIGFTLTAPNAELEGWLSSKGAKLTRVDKNNIYILENYEVEDLRVLSSNRAVKQSCYVPIGIVTIDAYRTWTTVERIAYVLHRAHPYPSIMDMAHLENIEEKFIPLQSLKRTIPSEEGGPPTQKVRTEDGSIATGSEATSAEPVVRIELKKAKPPRDSILHYDVTSPLPDWPAILLPFVQDLAESDSATVADFIEKYYLDGLASTFEECFAVLENIRSVAGQLSHTLMGKVYAHMFKCFDIAYRAQCVAVPRFAGGHYQGCVILGYGYSLRCKGIQYHSSTPDVWRKDLVKMDNHGITLRRITELLRLDSVPDTMRKLRTIVMSKIGGMTRDETNALKEMLPSLEFPIKWWPQNTTSLKRSLYLIRNIAEEISEFEPMHHLAVLQTGREWEVLSAYGPFAPSLLIPNAPRQLLKKKAEEVKFLVTIPTLLETAIEDMIHLRTQHWITNVPTSVSAKNQTRSVDAKDKDEVWRALQELRIDAESSTAEDHESKPKSTGIEYDF